MALSWKRLLIAGDGRRTASRQWILFTTQSLDVTPKTTEHSLIIRIGKSEAEGTTK